VDRPLGNLTDGVESDWLFLRSNGANREIIFDLFFAISTSAAILIFRDTAPFSFS
jgi:hypothetical protein